VNCVKKIYCIAGAIVCDYMKF